MAGTVEDKQVLELLTVGDVALFVGVSGDAIRDAVDGGRLSVAALTPSGMRLFAVDEVQRYKRDREARAAERRR